MHFRGETPRWMAGERASKGGRERERVGLEGEKPSVCSAAWDAVSMATWCSSYSAPTPPLAAHPPPRPLLRMHLHTLLNLRCRDDTLVDKSHFLHIYCCTSLCTQRPPISAHFKEEEEEEGEKESVVCGGGAVCFPLLPLTDWLPHWGSACLSLPQTHRQPRKHTCR